MWCEAYPVNLILSGVWGGRGRKVLLRGYIIRPKLFHLSSATLADDDT